MTKRKWDGYIYIYILKERERGERESKDCTINLMMMMMMIIPSKTVLMPKVKVSSQNIEAFSVSRISGYSITCSLSYKGNSRWYQWNEIVTKKSV